MGVAVTATGGVPVYRAEGLFGLHFGFAYHLLCVTWELVRGILLSAVALFLPYQI